MKKNFICWAFVFMWGCTSQASDDMSKSAKTPSETGSPDTQIPEPYQHAYSDEGKFFGNSLEYEVVASDHYLKDEQGKPTASLFSLYYRKKDVEDPKERPITYVFNGGPGSSSVWLHMGLLGPRRVVVPSDAQLAGAPPYPVEDNKLSLLAVSDLVFIDPIGTGYSRMLVDKPEINYFGVDEDADSIARFIREHVTENGRWSSPKFILGESYGTTRSGLLVEKLQEGEQTLFLNGVILISAVLDFAMNDFYPGNDQPYLAYLPTYAATAFYHNRLPQKPESLSALLHDVRSFAFNTYASALLKGNQLSEEEQQYISNQLQSFTGLSDAYLRKTHFRIQDQRFMKELLRSQSKVVGRFDGRYLGEDYDDAGETSESDPSSYGIDGAYVSAQHHYLHNRIGVKRDREYRIFYSEAFDRWNWTSSAQEKWLEASPISVVGRLSKGLRQNPDLQLFVANGYYDLATPFFATELALTRPRMDPSRINMHYYEAGHMMYTHKPSFERLAEDLKQFVLKTTNKPKTQAKD